MYIIKPGHAARFQCKHWSLESYKKTDTDQILTNDIPNDRKIYNEYNEL